MEGWCSVEDLVRWAFAHAPVVMANEEEWIPMGWHFREMSGVDPFVIDQDVTVDFGERHQEWMTA